MPTHAGDRQIRPFWLRVSRSAGSVGDATVEIRCADLRPHDDERIIDPNPDERSIDRAVGLSELAGNAIGEDTGSMRITSGW